MSQFATGQGSQLQALGALARTAGEGKKFLTRFEMEQKALGTALRAQQQQQQAQSAEADRGVQLQKLAAEQESRRFTQALQAQAQQRQAQQDSVSNELSNQKIELQQEQEARRLGEAEADLQRQDRRIDISEEALNVTRERESRLTKTQSKDQQKQLVTLQSTALGNIQKARSVIDAPLSNATPEQKAELEGVIEVNEQTIARAQAELDTIALAKAEKVRQLETQQAVSLSEASPETALVLRAMGQTKVLPRPASIDQLEVTRVYFFPGKGSFLYMGPDASPPFEDTQKASLGIQRFL